MWAFIPRSHPFRSSYDIFLQDVLWCHSMKASVSTQFALWLHRVSHRPAKVSVACTCGWLRQPLVTSCYCIATRRHSWPLLSSPITPPRTHLQNRAMCLPYVVPQNGNDTLSLYIILKLFFFIKISGDGTTMEGVCFPALFWCEPLPCINPNIHESRSQHLII